MRNTEKLIQSVVLVGMFVVMGILTWRLHNIEKGIEKLERSGGCPAKTVNK
jgi:hypothetical protein